MTILHYRWTFRPQNAEVILAHDHGSHPADVRHHKDVADELGEDNLVHGYAYKIEGGWRLTDSDHKSLDDPFIKRRILDALDRGHLAHTDTHQDVEGEVTRTHYGKPML